MNVHEIVLKRNYFYDQLVSYQTILTFVLLTGIFFNIYFFNTVYNDQIRPTYFTTDASGFFLKDVPRSQPLFTDDEVAQWVSGKIVDIFSFNHFNFKNHLNNISKDFDPEGYTGFMRALNETRFFQSITRHKYLCTVTVEKPFKVERHLVMNNVYGWIVKGDILVEYINKDNRLNPVKNKMEMTIYVTRQSLFMYPEGIAFMVIVAKT